MKHLSIFIIFAVVVSYNTIAFCQNSEQNKEVELTIFINKTSISSGNSKIEILFRLRFSKDMPMDVNKNISATFSEGSGIVLYLKKDTVFYRNLIMYKDAKFDYVKIKEGLEITGTITIDLNKVYPVEKLFDKENKKIMIPNYLNNDYGKYQIQAKYIDESLFQKFYFNFI